MKTPWEAFAFPFRRDHLGILAVGVFVLSLLPAGLSFFPKYWYLQLIVLACYAVFLRSILHATMNGEDRIPAWPEIDGWEDALQDVVSVAAPFVVSFAPAFAVHAIRVGVDGVPDPVLVLSACMPVGLAVGSPALLAVEVVLIAAGWLYLPMATLAWTFYGGWAIFNPVAVAKAAWSTGPSYLVLCFLVWITVTAAWAVSLVPAPLLTAFGSSLLALYALIVAARLVGLHYRAHRATLDWEARRGAAADPE